MVESDKARVLAEFVERLAPDGQEVTPTNEPAELEAASKGLPAGAVGWAIETGRRCADTVVVLMGPERAKLLEDGTRHGLEMMLLSVVRSFTGAEEGAELDRWQKALVTTMARLDDPYEAFVAGLRRVQDIVLESVLDRASWHPQVADRPQLLRSVTGIVSSYFDHNVSSVVEEYLAERQRSIAQTLSDQRRVASALVAGEQVPIDAANHTLGIDLTQHHLALVVWPRDRSATLRSDPQDIAARAARALHAPPPLILPDDSDTGAVLCWITSPTPFPSHHVDTLDDLFAQFDDIRTAIGPAGTGPKGFRRSHLGARDAERVAQMAGHGTTVHYTDVGAVALLTADPERAGWFVTEELGPLLAPDDATLADLRDTALCFMNNGKSLVRTAEALHVHRNTVVYRLQNMERLLGRSLDERPFTTHAALTLADQLGDSILVTAAGRP
ncbi:PucR family transcriptional regulator [Streptomyces sp. NPDC002577]